MYRIVIWGTGNYYKRYINRFKDDEILAIVDNNIDKQGKILDGHSIISPRNLNIFNADYYVILCANYEEIVDQVISLGINKDSIIIPSLEGEFRRFRKVIRKGRQGKGEFLLISHAMDMRGAPLMLYELAKILGNKGILVDVATCCDGPLEDEFIKTGISILKFDDFIFHPDELGSFFSGYKNILINTLALNSLVKIFIENNIKIWWWIHEEWSAYDILTVDKSINIKSDKLQVLCVGRRAKDAFVSYFGMTSTKQLQWGIELHESKNNIKNKDDIIIAIIGPVTYIKGQDLFLKIQAVNEWMKKNRVKVWLIGYTDDDERKRFSGFEWITMKGEYRHDDLLKLYDDVDVVLSTSRNDTMPVSLVEGLMKKKLVVTSDGTGVSDYITNGYDGLIFKRDDPYELWHTLDWIINNKSQWELIQQHGFELYKRIFSLESFEETINKLFEF